MDTRNNRVKRELPTNTTATMFNSVTKLSSTAHHRGDNNDAKIGESLNEKGNAAAQEAIRLAIMTLPVYTGFGLLALIAGQSNKGGERVEVMRVLGAPLTVIGVVADTVKAPFYFVFATTAALKAAMYKISATIIKSSPIQEFEARMLASFILRLTETAQLLCELGLITQNEMQRKLEEGEVSDLIGLTLLATAFASRHTPFDALTLADEGLFHSKDCPENGRALFDTCIEVKNFIAQALKDTLTQSDLMMHNDNLHLKEAEFVLKWIPYIYAGKEVALSDVPEADRNNFARLNQLIQLIHQLTVQGKALLPVEEQEVAHQAASGIAFNRK